jgi:hypothetical protein
MNAALRYSNDARMLAKALCKWARDNPQPPYSQRTCPPLHHQFVWVEVTNDRRAEIWYMFSLMTRVPRRFAEAKARGWPTMVRKYVFCRPRVVSCLYPVPVPAYFE